MKQKYFEFHSSFSGLGQKTLRLWFNSMQRGWIKLRQFEEERFLLVPPLVDDLGATDFAQAGDFIWKMGFIIPTLMYCYENYIILDVKWNSQFMQNRVVIKRIKLDCLGTNPGIVISQL